MSKRGGVQSTAGQIGELVGNFVKFFTKMLIALNGTQLSLLEKKQRQIFDDFREIVGKVVVVGVADNGYQDLVVEWEKFYNEVFGLTVNLSNLVPPAFHNGFNWLIVVLEGMTLDHIFNRAKEWFEIRWLTTNPDSITSPRTATKNYAVWCRDRIEADEEHKNKSANQCKRKGLNILTVEERMLLELWHHWKTGGHLDINQTLTLTSSRTPDDLVVCVRWDATHGRVSVADTSPDHSVNSWRSREVVS